MQNNLITSMFVLAILVACTIACGGRMADSSTPKNSTSSQTAKGKLLIQNESKGTGVYQTDVIGSGDLKLKGNVVPGKYEIEYMNTAHYNGKPACDSESVALEILHSSKVKNIWWFPSSPKVSFIIDGKTTNPVKLNFLPMDKENGEYIEALIMQPTCETISQFAKAQAAEIHINDAAIVMSTDDIAAFKAFAGAIGLQ